VTPDAPDAPEGARRDPYIINFVTLFPEVIAPYMAAGVVGRAAERGLLSVRYSNIRDYGVGGYRVVDDLPFGGGAGMLLKAEPVAQAIDALAAPGRRVLLTPNGRPFTQADAARLAALPAVTFICGRYEGIDARVLFDYVDEPLSVGDYVLSGGELPAMTIADAVTRLLPGVLNNAESVIHESHSTSAPAESGALLEHPHYTRPAVWRGYAVPEVLLSGHHARVEAWRRAESIKITARVRPELLQNAHLTPTERAEAERLAAEERS
jgi:tRNA (guanine37-N1)-methyltransferase